MSESPRSFRDLRVWQQACDLAVSVYGTTKSFPKDELYGLTSQMRRAAVSVPSNLSEGAGRLGAVEYRHFVSIALGSLAELRTLAELARRFGYLSEERAQLLDEQITLTERSAWTLCKRLTDRAGS